MLLKNAYMDFEKIEYSQKIWLKDTEEHFATMAQVLFSSKSYIASVSYDNVL